MVASFRLSCYKPMNGAYNDVSLLPINTYGIKIALRTEPTAMYPIELFIDTGTTPNLLVAAFIRPKWNSRIMDQDTRRL